MTTATREEPTTIWAAKLAAYFAQQFGLPAGNMWEPGIARSLEKAANAGENRAAIRQRYSIQWGLPA